MAEEAKTDDEPSIEEILDSIRQIISEDDEEEVDDQPAEVEDEKPVPAVTGGRLDQSAVDSIEFDAPAKDEPAESGEPLDQSAIDAMDFGGPSFDEEVADEPEDVIDESDDEVLDLTERVGTSDELDVDLVDELEEEPEPEPEFIAPEPEPEEEMDEPMEAVESDIFTEKAESAAVEAISQLVKKTAVERGGITIEEIVRSELKPMLREWLDRNLPSLIERLVAEELERVSKRLLDD